MFPLKHIIIIIIIIILLFVSFSVKIDLSNSDCQNGLNSFPEF